MTTASWVPCPMCFHPADPDARFCSRCGARMDGGSSVSIPGRDLATNVAPPDATVAFDRTPPPPPPTTVTATGDGIAPPIAGRYRLEKELGRGSFGVVMKGWDDRDKRPVALKMLPGLSQVDPEERHAVMTTFRREAQALAWLKHPAIVALVDVVEDAEVPCLVMELVDGETLAARITREGPLPIRDALQILRELVQALHHAHSAGVVHRDLKPANILLGSDGVVKVTDFGLAKVTTSVAASMGSKGGLLGTPHYMSPEQASGRDLDARSDLFAVGAIAWEMLTGKRAFDGPLQTAIYRIIYEGVPKPSSVRPDVPPALDAVVMKALEKNVDVRFQNALELDGALEAAAATLTVATPTDEMAVPDVSEVAEARLRATGEMPTPPGVLARAGQAVSAWDSERKVLLAGMLAAIVAGLGALVMLAQRPEPGTPPPANLPPGLHVSGEGVAYLDGARLGVLPLDVPLPSAGRHLVTVIVPREGVMRRTIDVPQIPTYLEVKVSELTTRSAPSPEELQVIGTLVGDAAPVVALALVDGPDGRGWVHAGEPIGEASVAAIDADGVVFALPLSPPESGSWSLRRPAAEIVEPLASDVNVGSKPSGMVVRIGVGTAALGYTPCQVKLPDQERITIVLTDTERKLDLVLKELDARRLAFMGELMVVMPPPQSDRGTR